MEVLQMLRFGFSKEPFNFTKGILTDENDLTIEFDDNANVLAELVYHEHTDTQQEDIIDRFIATEGAE
jgi:hypothetical protein